MPRQHYAHPAGRYRSPGRFYVTFTQRNRFKLWLGRRLIAGDHAPIGSESQWPHTGIREIVYEACLLGDGSISPVTLDSLRRVNLYQWLPCDRIAPNLCRFMLALNIAVVDASAERPPNVDRRWRPALVNRACARFEDMQVLAQTGIGLDLCLSRSSGRFEYRFKIPIPRRATEWLEHLLATLSVSRLNAIAHSTLPDSQPATITEQTILPWEEL